MSWPTFTVDVTQNSNQIKIYGPVPASEIPAGFEVIIGNVSNLEVSYGTAIMYDGSNNPYSHLYLVRPYTGTAATNLEMVVKPTGSQFNDVVGIFQNGSNLLNSTMEGYRQFVEGTNPVTFQPLDENAAPISIKPLQQMNEEAEESITQFNQDSQAAITQFNQDGQASLASHTQSINELLANKTTDGDDTTPGALLAVGAKIDQLNLEGSNIKFEPPCRATLDLDFANQKAVIYSKLEGFVEKPFSDIVTQGRATAGSSVDAIGGTTEVAAGENRFTFDGETGEALGYLSEESRTNLLTNSEFPNGFSDATTGGLISLESIDLGNGNVNAIGLGYDGSTTSFCRKGISLTGSTTYIFSIFVEMSDGSPPHFGSSSFSSSDNDFYLELGSNKGDMTESVVTKLHGNVYRISSVITYATGDNRAQVVKYATNSPRTFKVTGYQLEVGSSPASYIKTLDLPVARAADSMTRALGQEWNPNEGTFVVELGDVVDTAGLIYPYYIAVRDSTTDGLYLFKDSLATIGTTIFTLRHLNSGTAVNLSINGSSKIMAFSYGNGRVIAASDITPAVEATYPSLFTSNLLGILCRPDSLIGQANSAIKRLQYYPRAFDALTLQRLSRIQ